MSPLDEAGQDPYSLSEFAIQTSPHFKEDFNLTINVTDEIQVIRFQVIHL